MIFRQVSSTLFDSETAVADLQDRVVIVAHYGNEHFSADYFTPSEFRTYSSEHTFMNDKGEQIDIIDYYSGLRGDVYDL